MTPEARALTRQIASLRGKIKRRWDTISLLRSEAKEFDDQLYLALNERKRLKETK